MSTVYKPRRILIARILGNDVPGLHGDTQTIENLRFTIQNEKKYPIFENVYFLNRMYNKTKKNRIIHLLSHHNIRFIDIPFHIKPYINLLKRCPALISPRLPASVLLSFRNQLTQFNHLIANNNGARNTVLEYGRRLGYEWTFVLDSNSFIDDTLYESLSNIFRDSSSSPRFIVLPQVRLQDKKLDNHAVLQKDPRIRTLPKREPQLAFHISTRETFEEKLPYGSAPKAEFLARLGVPGPWNAWAHGACRRHRINRQPNIRKTWAQSKRIIRLSPFEVKNCFSRNAHLRTVGIVLHVNKIYELYNLKIESL